MGLDATPGGAGSNSYLTREEAGEYFARRLRSSAWTGAEDADKDIALQTATARLDQEEFYGARTERDQALKWPRVGACDSDGFSLNSDEVPRIVRDATCELAIALLEEAASSSALGKLARLKIGPLEITPREDASSDRLPAQVTRLLAPVLMSAPGTIRMVRG